MVALMLWWGWPCIGVVVVVLCYLIWRSAAQQ
jgi:hypothetical protein